MKKLKKVISIVLALSLIPVMFAGCGKKTDLPSPPPAPAGTKAPDTTEPPASSNETAPVILTIGASPTPHALILEHVKPALAAKGITLVITEFDDYVLPNTAVEDGSLDANYFQHLPYLDTFNKENGTHLVSVGAVHIEPLGIYPGKKSSLAELADGDIIAVPDDGSNESRALSLLALQGYITFEDGKTAADGLTVKDIKNNPKNLQIKELVAETLPSVLPDVDFAIINGNFSVGAGISDKVLAREDANSPYVNIVVVKEGNENNEAVKALVDELQSKDTAEFINSQWQDVVVPLTK